MTVDTGASKSILSEHIYKQLVKVDHQAAGKFICLTYKNTGKALKLLGKVTTVVKCKSKQLELSEGCGPNMLGRDWLSHIKIDWHEIYQVHTTDVLSSLLDTHSVILNSDLGELKSIKVKINVKDNSTPQIFKPGDVPHILKLQVQLLPIAALAKSVVQFVHVMITN